MKKIILAVAVAAVAIMAIASAASADVARYQLPTTLVVSLTDAQLGNHHTFTIASACDASFTGTGQASQEAGGATETITGTLVGDHLKFTAVYDATSWLPGYTWSYDGSLSGVALGGQAAGYHATAVVASTTFKNHGDYVSSHSGVDDAAHSCVGMPIH